MARHTTICRGPSLTQDFVFGMTAALERGASWEVTAAIKSHVTFLKHSRRGQQWPRFFLSRKVDQILREKQASEAG